MSSYTSLTDAEIQQIFDKKIKPELFKNSVTTTKEPKAIFLAGQPGAGKTDLADITHLELKKNSVLIDIDHLRQFHPSIKTVKDQYDLDGDTRKFRNLVIAECVKNKYNTVFDGTLGGNMKYIEADMMQMKNEGFTVKISVLAVNDSISKLGFISRFEEQVLKTGTGRNVDLSYHNEIYKNIPNNITEAVGKKIVTEMNIYKKNQDTRKTELIKTYGSETFKLAKDIPLVDFYKERSRDLSFSEKKALGEWYEKTIRTAIKNNSNYEQIKNAIVSDDPRLNTQQKNAIVSFKEIDYKKIINDEFHIAFKNGKLKTVDTLIKIGADISTLNKEETIHKLEPKLKQEMLNTISVALKERTKLDNLNEKNIKLKL